jgi:hypothetical protein
MHPFQKNALRIRKKVKNRDSKSQKRVIKTINNFAQNIFNNFTKIIKAKPHFVKKVKLW